MTEHKTAQYDVLSGTQDERIAALTADNAALRQALEPFKQFCEVFDAKPINGLDAEQIYGIHGGKHVEGGIAIEWEHMRGAQRALQSPNPGTELLERRAEELALCDRYKALLDEIAEIVLRDNVRSVVAVNEIAGLVVALRQRAIAAEERENRLDRLADAQDKALAAVTKERDEAREALDKYGEHTSECERWEGGTPNGPCTCGFDAALLALRPAPKEPRRIDAKAPGASRDASDGS